MVLNQEQRRFKSSAFSSLIHSGWMKKPTDSRLASISPGHYCGQLALNCIREPLTASIRSSHTHTHILISGAPLDYEKWLPTLMTLHPR